MIHRKSKVLILNAMGRSGTTLLQNMLCQMHGLTNMGESITYDRTRADSIRSLAMSDGWVCKLFVELDTARFNHEAEIDELSPDVIYNVYRVDKLDQFLSHQISILNDKWNGDSRLEYVPASIPDPVASVRYFLGSVASHASLVESLRRRFAVVDLSYEDMTRDPATTAGFGLSKQNDFGQKLALIENIEDVLAAWQECNAGYGASK